MKKFDSDEEIDSDTIINIMGKIDTNADRATKITNHMRQIARKSDLQLEQVQLNDVVRSSSEIFNQQLKVRGIDIIYDLQDNLPIIKGDWGRLEEVIINLVLNARDSIEEKCGEKNRPHCRMKITLKTRETEDGVMVEICDTGTGVPNGLADKIFDPFFTTKEIGKGTGLGLSISYAFIKNCRGKIRIDPNPGGGSCFVITFPKLGAYDGEEDLTSG
jgi:histidine kinase